MTQATPKGNCESVTKTASPRAACYYGPLRRRSLTLPPPLPIQKLSHTQCCPSVVVHGAGDRYCWHRVAAPPRVAALARSAP